MPWFRIDLPRPHLFGQRHAGTGVKFIWEGADEGGRVSGHGWASLVDNETIEGHLFFHLGGDSSFEAKLFGSDEELDGQ